jgi:type II secretory pathway component PulF
VDLDVDDLLSLSLGLVGPCLLFLAIVVAFAWWRSRLRGALLEHLAAVAHARLPLGPGLHELAADRRGGIAWSIRGVAERLETTGSLAVALERAGRAFPREARELVRLAEARGALPAALEVLDDEERRGARAGWRVLTRFAYPTILSIAVLAISTFLVSFVEPKFTSILDAVLPALGPHVAEGYPGELPALANLALALAINMTAIVTALLVQGRFVGRALAWLVLGVGSRLPLVGPPLRGLALARALRRLAAFLGSSTPLPDAIDAVARSTPFAPRGLAAAAAAARRGEPLERALEAILGRDASTHLPRLALALHAQGPARGLASFAESLTDRSVRRLETIGETARPVPVVLIALVVFTHASAIFGAIGALQRAMTEAALP